VAVAAAADASVRIVETAGIADHGLSARNVLSGRRVLRLRSTKRQSLLKAETTSMRMTISTEMRAMRERKRTVQHLLRRERRLLRAASVRQGSVVDAVVAAAVVRVRAVVVDRRLRAAGMPASSVRNG
jgi:hypothetical protein